MSSHDMGRRTLLKLSGLALVGATAGCLESEEDGTTTTTTEESGGGGGGGEETTTTTEESGGGGESYTIGMVDSLTGSLAPYGERNTRAANSRWPPSTRSGSAPRGRR